MSRLTTGARTEPRRADLTGLFRAEYHAASFTGLPATLGNIWSSMMLYWLSLTWYEWIQPLLLVEGMECGKVGFNVAGFQKTEDRRRVVRYASLRQWANLSCASITLAPLSAGQVTCAISGPLLVRNSICHCILKKESSASLRPVRPVRRTLPSLRLSGR